MLAPHPRPRWFTALPLVFALGCTHAPTPPQLDPLPRTPGEPVTLEILGAKYTFPARLDFPNHVQKPNIYGMQAKDSVTGCEVALNFETVTDGAELRRFTDELITEKTDAIRAKGLDTKIVEAPFELLGQKGRLIERYSFTPIDLDDHYSSWRFEVFVPEQSLAVHGFVDCKDEAQLQQTLDVVAAAVGTQTRK